MGVVTLIVAMITIIFGLLVLLLPKFLRIVVGLYFLISGSLMLFDALL